MADESKSKALARLNRHPLWKELDEILARTHFQVRKRQAEVPKTLYHYTSGSGCIGIVTHGQLWATHAQHSNDPYEVTYGDTLARDVARGLLLKTGGAKEAFKDLAWGKGWATSNLYVVCLTTERDHLPQWRAYAANGKGYMVGFDTSRWTIPKAWNLYQVVYDQKVQRELLYSAMGLAGSALDRYFAKKRTTVGRRDALTLAQSFIRNVCDQCSAIFKAREYDVEHEWRLVYTQQFRSEFIPEFRDGAHGITPYVTVSPQVAGDGKRLAFSEIMSGPRNEPELATRGLQLLLNRFGYQYRIEEPDRSYLAPPIAFSKVLVSQSPIKYRG